jgi:hypothetical protein
LIINLVLIVLVLCIVAAAALHFADRRKPVFVWRGLSERFSTEIQHDVFAHHKETVYAPTTHQHFARDGQFQGEYGTFDVDADERGLWLRHVGPVGRCAPMLLIPWADIKIRRSNKSEIVITILDDQPISLCFSPKVGATIAMNKV